MNRRNFLTILVALPFIKKQKLEDVTHMYIEKAPLLEEPILTVGSSGTATELLHREFSLGFTVSKEMLEDDHNLHQSIFRK